MGYKMQKMSSNTFLGGLGIVQTNPNYPGVFRVQLSYKDESGEKVTKKFVVKKENAPSWLKSGEWSVRINPGDEPKIVSAFPFADTVDARFHSIPSKEGEIPTPKTKTGQYGPYQTFTILTELMEDRFKPKRPNEEPCLVPMTLHYKFTAGHDAKYGEVAAYKGSKGVALETLIAAMESFGILEKVDGTDYPLRWMDNLLPVIMQRGVKQAQAGRVVRLTISDGFVSAIRRKMVREETEDDTWGDEEEDETPAELVKSKPKPQAELDPDEELEPEPFGTGETPTEQKTGVAPSDPPWDEDDEIQMG